MSVTFWKGAHARARRSAAAFIFTTAVLTALMASAAAFADGGTTVRLSVDGSTQQVTTFATTVGGLLARQGVRVGSRGVVEPARRTPLRNGMHVVVRHAHRILFQLDGAPARALWVAEPTVGAALATLGIDATGAYVSPPTGARLGGDTHLVVRRPQLVAVLVDGHRLQATTTSPTVAGLLHQLAVRLGPHDLLSPPLAAYPKAGTVVRVTRVTQRQEQVTRAIPFGVQQRPDASLLQGQQQILRAGRDGVELIVYLVTLHDGVPVHRSAVAAVTRQAPVAEVIAVGTASPPPVASAPANVADLDWPALADCESGGNPRAVSPNGQYRGLYQFSIATWQSLGGSGDPINASPQEQTYRAQLLYERDGTSPWPVCGSRLYS